MVLDQITGRRTELTGEIGLLRKQLADAEHELDLCMPKCVLNARRT